MIIINPDNIENYIEAQIRELEDKRDESFLHLYYGFEHAKFKLIFSSLHSTLNKLFKLMNERLPTNSSGAHFWADPSRELLNVINMVNGLKDKLSESPFAFQLDNYYQGIFNLCESFLSRSGGSEIPPRVDTITLYYRLPIFVPSEIQIVRRTVIDNYYNLKIVGEGSYAYVYKYHDDYYQRDYIVKRAKKDLNDKEIIRFSREYQEMEKLSSPYVVEVFRFNENRKEYVMEFMDTTLHDYIQKNNGSITLAVRQSLAFQVIRAFEYIHSKNLLHRDISPNNVLLKLYDDVIVVKISDFGLVRIPNSVLTTVNTEFKGSFNDPSLRTEGFDTYDITHETYALTMLMLYIMTGSTKADKIKDSNFRIFVNKGLNPDKTKRFQNVHELANGFRYTLEKKV